MSSPESLMGSPVWEGVHLGEPIPSSPHAISVALPRWDDVVGYEERDPEVWDRIRAGYPRFVIHPKVEELKQKIIGPKPGLPFPSSGAAEAALEYLERYGHGDAEVIKKGGTWVLRVGAVDIDVLRSFWQHTGLVVSSRQAECILEGRRSSAAADSTRAEIREWLAKWYECSPDDIFLFPSGMAAVYAALRCINTRSPGQPTVQYGFPYVDNLKLQEKVGHGALFFSSYSDETLSALKDHFEQPHHAAGLFCEIPGNPLLGCPHLVDVAPLLRGKGVPLVVDDTVATPFNVDLSQHSDLIATSLTKYMAGTGDVMGGALICNPASPLYAELKSLASALDFGTLWDGDAEALVQHLPEFPARMEIHNRNGLEIAERLRAHPAVDRVWYPKWEEDADSYDAVRRPGGGWGSLMSFIPKHAAKKAQPIFDSMQVCKGPSLGTIYTLACPFTLLAHYDELDWAESCGVSRYMIRLSIGIEDVDKLWRQIRAGLEAD